MLDAVCALMGARFQQYFATSEDLPPLGAGHPQATPWQVFEASDGSFVVTVNTDGLWHRLCAAMGLTRIGEDPRFETAIGRLRGRDEITAALADEFIRHPRAYWSKLLDDAGVPSGPVLLMSEVSTHPQVVHNQIFPEVPGLDSVRTDPDAAAAVVGRPGYRADPTARTRRADPFDPHRARIFRR